MMLLLKWILKLLVLPLVPLTSLLQWLGILLVSISSTVINMVLGIVAMIVVGSWMLGLTSQGNVVCGLTLCGILFILPYIARWCVVRFAGLHYILMAFVRS